MASYTSTNPIKVALFCMTMLFCFQHYCVCSFEYQVGGLQGWVVPSANDTNMYNDWASENRFEPGDSIRFRYQKDSVMEVTEEDYNKCNSSHPNFFSNTGDTIFHLTHSRPYYFISGAFGHCKKGQKMIVKVLSSDGIHLSGGASPSAGFSLGLTVFALFQFGLAYVVCCLF